MHHVRAVDIHSAARIVVVKRFSRNSAMHVEKGPPLVSNTWHAVLDRETTYRLQFVCGFMRRPVALSRAIGRSDVVTKIEDIVDPVTQHAFQCSNAMSVSTSMQLKRAVTTARAMSFSEQDLNVPTARRGQYPSIRTSPQ